ncbi:MAG: hypothetical protein J6S67_04650 [Methanobrevibacter sp.]|nr:hypothetical protein [Methanobrevibacter sp.]
MINLKQAKKVFVEQLHNKNQFVITFYNDGIIWAFQSYRSLIALYSPETKELYINQDKWDYSKTTLKHFKAFVNEYTCYNYETKLDFVKNTLTKESKIVFFIE